VVKTSCVEVNSSGKEGLSNMLSILGQMREGSEMRENLSRHKTEDMRKVVLVCKLPIVSRVTLLFTAN
jgi:hypothetical protein